MKPKNELINEILTTLINSKNLLTIEPKVDIKEMGVPFYKHLVMLVDTGFLNYTKMTSENYYYWWYEVDANKHKPNKNIFTADLSAFKITRKGEAIYKLKQLDYYKDSKYSDLLLEYDRLFEIDKDEFVEIFTYRTPLGKNICNMQKNN